MATFAKPEPVQLAHLTANPYQPRLTINVERLAPLVASIREFGFIGHLEARRHPEDPKGRLQLIYGHRRVRAAELAGLTTIPVAIVARGDDHMRRLAFMENTTVEELSYWEQGVFLQKLKQEAGWTIEELGKQVGRTKGWVQNRLDVLRLPEGSALREAAQADTVAMTSALVLLSVDPDEREELFTRLQQGEINSDDLKAMRRTRTHAGPASAGPPIESARQPWTSVEHARWVVRHLESAMPMLRRHGTKADFAALSPSEQARLVGLRTEVLGLLDGPSLT